VRIIFYFADYPPALSGVGCYMQSMARSLSMSGNKVIIVTAKVPGEPAIVDDGNIIIHRAYSREHARKRHTAETILSIARKYDADLIEGADHLGECAQLIRIKNRPPILIKVHSSNALRIINRSETLYGWQKPPIACRTVAFLASMPIGKSQHSGSGYVINSFKTSYERTR